MSRIEEDEYEDEKRLEFIAAHVRGSFLFVLPSTPASDSACVYRLDMMWACSLDEFRKCIDKARAALEKAKM